MNQDNMIISDMQYLTLNKNNYTAPILDIGGGGEGVIGKLYGKNVVAIDIRKDELEETSNEALKIVMDATDLKFLDNSFPTATAFFTLMYMNHETKLKALKEAYRVLKPGGILDVYEVNMPPYMGDNKEIFVLQLKYTIDNKETQTGYGCRLKAKNINKEYYLALLQSAGFVANIVFEKDQIFKISAQKAE